MLARAFMIYRSIRRTKHTIPLGDMSGAKFGGTTNNVLLGQIDGLIWYTIYHQLPVVEGVSLNPSINQPSMGKRPLWVLQ